MCVRPPASAGLPPREQTVAVVVDVANLHIALSRHLSFSTLHLDQLLDTLLGQIGWLALQTGGLCGQPDPCGKRLAKKCKMVHGSASRGRFLKQQFFTVLRCLFVCLFADLKSKVFIFDFPAHWVVPIVEFHHPICRGTPDALPPPKQRQACALGQCQRRPLRLRDGAKPSLCGGLCSGRSARRSPGAH